MEGLLFFVNEQEGSDEVSRKRTSNMNIFDDVKSQHLVVVLVVEHLVHGVGTEDKEGNVNVSSNLKRKRREYEIRAQVFLEKNRAAGTVTCRKYTLPLSTATFIWKEARS